MAFLEREIMSKTASEELTATPTSTEDYLRMREEEFRKTSLPGEEFDARTGEIKKHITTKNGSGNGKVNINDLAAEEVEKELGGITPDLPTERRPLARPRLART
jgi:hypothetical protein